MEQYNVWQQEFLPKRKLVDANDLVTLIETMVVDSDWSKPYALDGMAKDRWAPFIEHPDVELVHLARLSALMSLLSVDGASSPDLAYRYARVEPILQQYVDAHSGIRDSVGWAAALSQMGLPEVLFGHGVFASQTDWTGSELAPYFKSRMALLNASINGNRERVRALPVLEALQHRPASVTEPLWRVALGPNEHERQLAQAFLGREPDAVDRLGHALSNKDRDVQERAAIWLGHLGDASAIPRLQEALVKEKDSFRWKLLRQAMHDLGADTSTLESPSRTKTKRKGRLTKADALDDLLEELGHPWKHTRELDEPSLEIIDFYGKGRGKYKAVLAHRGWIVAFDGEGDFFEDDSHASLVREILSRAGVQVESITDHWSEDHGTILTVNDAGVSTDFVGSRGEPSDWADSGLIVKAAEHVLTGREFKIADLHTGDQTLMFAIVANDVWEAIVNSKIIKLKRHKIADDVLTLGEVQERFREIESLIGQLSSAEDTSPKEA